MKKLFALAITVICCYVNYAQWTPTLQLGFRQSFAAISSPSDNSIWAITNNFRLYRSQDTGATWNKIQPLGLAQNIMAEQLYAMNDAVAFLTVNTIFTGVGPGIVYRTTDSGHHWTAVFSHKGNCDIKMGMFDGRTGLLSCSFDSFNGSVKSGQQLYFTIDGGKHWKLHPFNPSDDYRMVSFATKGAQAAMSDFHHVYFSINRGLTWAVKQPLGNAGMLQFEDSSYAVASSSLTNLLVKRPRRSWMSEGNITGIGGALTALVLDGNECWASAAFDTPNLFYSNDSAKTFTTFIVDSTNAFILMTKARTGRLLIGATPAFTNARLWINKRQVTSEITIPIATSIKLNNYHQQSTNQLPNSTNIKLEQNIPGSVVQTTIIWYSLPQQYAIANVVIKNKEGIK